MTHLEVIKLLESGKTLVKRNPKYDTYYEMKHGDVYARSVQHEPSEGVKYLINFPKGWWWKVKEINFNGNFEVVED